MKSDLINKWRKVVSLKLDTSYYWKLMKKLNTGSIYQNYDLKNLRSEIQLMMTWIIRVFLFTTLVIYKACFKSHHIQQQRLRTHILCVKLMHLYALWFYNQVLPNLRHLWNEELCRLIIFIQVAGVSHVLGYVQRS